MFCIDDATKPLEIPKTDGYTDIYEASSVTGSKMFCSTGHRICGVRTKISNTLGLEAVEFVCCK